MKSNRVIIILFSFLFIFSFFSCRVKDDVPPTIIKTYPSNGATGVNINDDILIYFSEGLEEGAINGEYLLLYQDSTLIDSDLAYNSTTFIITMSPVSALRYNAQYTLKMTSDIADVNGNQLGADLSVVFTTNGAPDTTSPIAAVTSELAELTASDSIPVTITFSEPVKEFDISKTVISNGVASEFVVVSASTYTLNLVPEANGVVSIQIPDAACVDISGNKAIASNVFTITYDSDILQPVLSTTVEALTNMNPIPVNLTFSEDVKNFSSEDLNLTNSVVTSFTEVSFSQFTFGLVPLFDGTVSVSVLEGVCTDNANAGKRNAASTLLEFEFDSAEPRPEITTSSNNPTAASPIPFKLEFDEEVSGLEEGDFSIQNGTIATFSAFSTRIWLVDITPDSDGAVTVSFAADKVVDLAGNNNLPAVDCSVSYDSSALTVNITSAVTGMTNQNPIPVKIEFSEATSGFELADLVLTNASTSELLDVEGKEGLEFVCSLTPTGEGIVKLSISQDSCTDATGAGKGNKASAEFSVNFDSAAPQINSASGALTGQISLVLSEAAYGNADESGALEASDFQISVSNGAIVPTITQFDHIEGTTDVTIELSYVGLADSQQLNISAQSSSVFDAAGNSMSISSVSAGNLLPALGTSPTLTQQTAPDVDKITVDWVAVTGADNYSVFLGTDSDSSSAIEMTSDLDTTDTTCEITGLNQLTEYFVWVSAFNQAAESELSAIETITTPAGVEAIGDSLGGATSSYDFYADTVTPIASGDLLSNDVDYTATGKYVTAIISVTNGSYTVTTSSLDGKTIVSFIHFTPDNGLLDGDTASIVYQMENHWGMKDNATIAVAISTAPLFYTVSDSASVNQGDSIALSATNLISNDVSNLGSITFSKAMSSGVTGGTISVSGSGNSSTITFTSTGLAMEPASFEYEVNSGGSTQTGIVNISVRPLTPVWAYVYDDPIYFEWAKVELSPMTPADIFGNWPRFDGTNYFSTLADAQVAGNSNATSWVLQDNGTTNDASDDYIEMPMNVTPSNGFISAGTLENYVFEATATSPDGDNDNIGLIAAFYRDDANDKNYILTVMRSMAGMKPLDKWGLCYGTADQFAHGGDRGFDGDIIASSTVVGDPAGDGGWYGNKTRIKIVRTGDLIECWTTPMFTGSTVPAYDPNSYISLNLSLDSKYDKFKGASSYGYISFSQPDSTWLNIDIAGGTDDKHLYWVDSDGSCDTWEWDWAGSDWTLGATSIQDELGFVRNTICPNDGYDSPPLEPMIFTVKENSVELYVDN